MSVSVSVCVYVEKHKKEQYQYDAWRNLANKETGNVIWDKTTCRRM